MYLTDEELAARWWSRKTLAEKESLAKDAKFPIKNPDFERLSFNSIFWIWKKQPYNNPISTKPFL
jgi:hypothetical protein